MAGKRRADAVRGIGYKGDRPEDAAYKMLRRPDIRAAVNERESLWQEACDVGKAMIVNEIARVAFFDPRQLFDEHGALKPMQELDAASASAVQSVEVRELYADGGDDDGDPETRIAIGRVAKVRTGGKLEALKELATIYRLKNDEERPDAVRLGPGLTVIVQQGVVVQQSAGAAAAQPADAGETYEHLGMPPPGRTP